MTINELADMVKVNLVVRRYCLQDNRWSASLEGCEVKDGAFLRGDYGDGKTPGEAIQHYIDIISGKTLVLNAYKDNRQEFGVPKLEKWIDN